MPKFPLNAVLVAILMLAVAPALHAACGTQIEKTPVATGQNPLDVVAADFNGDGKDDIATPSTVTNNVRVRFGSATTAEAFEATHASYDVGTEPIEIRAAHFNGDGFIDLITLNKTAGTVSVLLNNGDGTFAAKIDTTVVAAPLNFSVGDLTGDGFTDIVVVPNSTAIELYAGNNAGGFALVTTLTSAGNVDGVTVADVDNDDDLDIVTATFAPSPAQAFIETYKNAPGGFTRTALASTYTGRIFAFDYRGTGFPDLLLTHSAGMASYTNDGTGAFTFVGTSNIGAMWDAAAADFDQDGVLDAVLARKLANTILVSGRGSFPSASGFNSWLGIATGDFNGDLQPDFVIVSSTANRAVAFINTCTKFASRTTVSATPNPVPYHGSVTITAVVTPVRADGPTPTGTMVLMSIGAPLTPGPGNTAIATHTFDNLENGTYTAVAQYLTGDATYNPTPDVSTQFVVLLPEFGAPTKFETNQSSAGIVWLGTQGVDHYEVWRMAGGTWSLAGTTSNTVFPRPGGTNVTYAYKVRGIAPDGTPSDFSAPDILAYFTETPYGPVSGIAAGSVDNYRRMINQLRTTAGLPPATWTDPNVYELPVKAIHVNEMRTRLAEARAVIGLTARTYDPVTVGTPIRRVHFGEMHVDSQFTN